jgi:2-polyprenyl-3-methyl-5-hydroxy-6-metoxy-1,4-benzoquinol methylase
MEIRTCPSPQCPVCGRAGVIVYEGITDRSHFVPGSWRHLRCTECAIVWLDPQPAPEDLGLCYSEGYYTHGHGDAEAVSPGRSALMRMLRGAVLSGKYGYDQYRPSFPMSALAGRPLALIPEIQSRATYEWNNALAPWRSGGSVLDIGCGSGAYLRTMRALGWKVFGVEPDARAADITRDRAGAEVFVGTIGSVELPLRSFDAVVSMHAIEHDSDPVRFLTRAAECLRPGGFLYIQTPNYNSLARRVFGRDWYALDPPRHLTMFTPASLAGLARQTGLLRSVRVRTLSRRSRREAEHVYALKQTGSFHGDLRLTIPATLAIGLFSFAEKAGNSLFPIGEEIELTAEAH